MKTRTSARLLFGLILASALAIAGCQEGPGGIPKAEAVAVLIPLSGSQVQGVIAFAKVSEGVRVRGTFSNLSPGLHGFHIHEYGDCRTEDGASAGGHFNPRDQIHGGPDAEQRHVGDLGNIQADEKGNGRVDFIATALSLEGDESIIGRSVVVHERQDDFRTQPDGDTGTRLACGVIGIAQK
jgi:superoxide dismutase, Cu-Zn family